MKLTWCQRKNPKLTLRLRQKQIPVLPLSVEGLPGMQTLPGYAKYVAPSLLTFPFGNAAFFIVDSVPQSRTDLYSLLAGAYECVAARIQWVKKVLVVASLYVLPEAKRKFEGVLKGFR